MEKEEKFAAPEDEFAAFWLAYPLKVGKLAARKAYDKARCAVDADTLLAGVDQYVRTKPVWQAWAHPSTWLHAGRWMDETPRQTARAAGSSVCPHEPCCSSFRACREKMFGRQAS